MAVQLLTESCILDASDKNEVVKQTQLYESVGGKILHEGEELRLLGVYRVPISRPGAMNKNNRLYTEGTWSPVLERKDGEGGVGLLDHPEPGKQPSIKDAFCVWKNHKLEKNGFGKPILKADMYLFDNANGRLVESILDAGGKVELSTRGYGEIKESGEVYNYNYKATDCVYEGSYSVNFSKNERVVGKTGTVQESTEIKSVSTNNHKASAGVSVMSNKILIRKAVNEAYTQKNKFAAFTELTQIFEDVKSDETLKEIAEDVQGKIMKLQGMLTEAHQIAVQEEDVQGDVNDEGTAGEEYYLDPENKIKNSDEQIPDDVHAIQVSPETETTDAGRGDQIGVQLGAAKGAMKKEVASGEVTHEATDVFEDAKGNHFIIENGQQVYVTLSEDTDEETPDDVKEIQISPEEETGEEGQGDQIDAQLGANHGEPVPVKESVNLYKLDKAGLIDTVLGMDEAIKTIQAQYAQLESNRAALEDYTIRLETYTLQAERVVESEKTEKDTARQEVAEAVAYAQSLHEKCQALEGQLNEQATYVAQLEEAQYEIDVESQRLDEVGPFVTNMLQINPSLAMWEREIRNAKTVTEARELANKYNNVRGKVRLDQVMVEGARQTAHSFTEADTQMSRLKSRGMI